MKLKLRLITLGVLFLTITSVKAQTDSSHFAPSHLQAAERMLVASGMQETMQKIFNQMFAIQSKQLPENQRPAFNDVMNKFVEKYANWEQLKAAFMPIYASEFSEDELNKMSDFLSTPAGKAMMTKQPELWQKGAEWGMKLGQDHRPELEQMMKEAMAKTNN
ncbi:MAG TPA: DUF2059 domain-containing protein [Mucilaginibacter sp.]|jgi:hypothetical protein